MTHPTIQGVKAALHRGEISTDTAATTLAMLGSLELADFIVTSFSNGWVTNYNLGLNHEGKPL